MALCAIHTVLEMTLVALDAGRTIGTQKDHGGKAHRSSTVAFKMIVKGATWHWTQICCDAERPRWHWTQTEHGGIPYGRERSTAALDREGSIGTQKERGGIHNVLERSIMTLETDRSIGTQKDNGGS